MIHLPTDTGEDARRFLRELGIQDVRPHVRSSDEDDCQGDNFRYYLTRRLGLTPAKSQGKALDLGQWLHSHFETLSLTVPEIETHRKQALTEKHTDIEAVADAGSLQKDDTAKLHATADYQEEMTWAWYEAALEIPVGEYSNFATFFLRPEWETIAVEQEFHIASAVAGFTPDVAQVISTIKPDRLILDKQRNRIHIVDYKSCAEPTWVRAATCPFEFQTWHYPFQLERLLCLPSFRKDLGLTSGVDYKVGSVYHVIQQKPTIEMGNSDRPFKWVAHSKRSGNMGAATPNDDETLWGVTFMPDPDKQAFSTKNEAEAITAIEGFAGVKAKKVFQDDPDPKRYVARTKRWYKAEGEYSHLAIERTDSPVIEISHTHSDLMLDPDVRDDYNNRWMKIAGLALAEAFPRNFTKNYKRLRDYGRLSVYAPFYTKEIADWPEIIQRGNFIIAHRDPLEEDPA
jgi:hypothetical protein